MRDDANELEMSLNHAHGSDASDASELPADLASTHEALSRLADAWSATIPSAARLATFMRQLPAQQAVTAAPDAAPALRERPHARFDDSGAPPHRSGGRLLAGLAAAIVIVSLLAATLLKLAPSRERRLAQVTPTAPAPTATLFAARAAEEPSQQPPNGAWATVAHALLIPAPSDGRVVYQTQGATASVSDDGGETWRDLKLPTFSQAYVASESVDMAVSDANSHLVLLTVTLSLSSANPADCPAGSTSVQPTALHGGILASGFITCNAGFISRDGGGSWTATHGLSTTFAQSTVWQVGSALYGLATDVNRQVAPLFPLVGVRLLTSPDQGVSWSYADTTLRTPSRFLCSVLPSAADGALYAVTYTSPCHSAGMGAHTHTVWRSTDGGATWSQLSTVDGLTISLIASSPTANGHGSWLYMLENNAPISSPDTLYVSKDGGASWRQIAQPPQADPDMLVFPINGALSDGSLVVSVVAQTGVSPAGAPEKATFYAWRPGDSAWRPLTTSLTANYAMAFIGMNSLPSVVIARGGQQAVDTLWVVEQRSPYGPNSYLSHAYAIR